MSRTGPTSVPAGRKAPRKKFFRPSCIFLPAHIVWFRLKSEVLANDFAALNKPPMETSFQVTEDFITEVTQEKQEDGSVKEVTHYDMEKVAAELKKSPPSQLVVL